MYPRPTTIHFRIAPAHAEILYYELLGLLAYYQEEASPDLDDNTEVALRLGINQLEAGLARANAIGEFQLEQLRTITNKNIESR